MKNILSFVIIMGLVAFCPPNEGTYRWDYKILIDPAGQALFGAAANATSIHALANLPRPTDAERKNQRAALENQKVTVTGYIIMDGQEDNDNDFHLVFKSTNTADTMIAEIPDPTTRKLRGFPGLRTKFAAGRNFVMQHIDANPTATVKPCPNGKVKVTISGIVFFDKIAHGKGHSKNGAEIHPVLDIKLAH
jgi:hypothetical protein